MKESSDLKMLRWLIVVMVGGTVFAATQIMINALNARRMDALEQRQNEVRPLTPTQERP